MCPFHGERHMRSGSRGSIWVVSILVLLLGNMATCRGLLSSSIRSPLSSALRSLRIASSSLSRHERLNQRAPAMFLLPCNAPPTRRQSSCPFSTYNYRRRIAPHPDHITMAAVVEASDKIIDGEFNNVKP